MKNRRLLGSLERQIMQLFWERLKPNEQLTVREAHEQLSGHGTDLAYTTVMTVMSRLADKGMLARTLIGRGYAYQAQVDAQHAVWQATEDFFQSLQGEFGEAALVHFAESLPTLDPKLAKQLRKAFEE